jgi:hypothetical protein
MKPTGKKSRIFFIVGVAGVCVAAALAEGDLIVISGAGYVGLAEWVQGDETGQGRYEEAVAAFKEGAEKYEDKRDYFRFGIDQLGWVKGKFVK